ncbi:MAG: hypothetical protein ACXWXT_14435 [Candidatus Binatia bacterium]
MRAKHPISNPSDAADPWAILMVAIATFFSLLILAPLAVVFYLSLFEGSLLDTVNRFSLKNYTTVFGEAFTYKVLWNTAGFSLSPWWLLFFSAYRRRGWSNAAISPAKPSY